MPPDLAEDTPPSEPTDAISSRWLTPAPARSTMTGATTTGAGSLTASKTGLPPRLTLVATKWSLPEEVIRRRDLLPVLLATALEALRPPAAEALLDRLEEARLLCAEEARLLCAEEA